MQSDNFSSHAEGKYPSKMST